MKSRSAGEQERTLSKSEKMASATHDAAWAIIDQERAKREAKNERLRQARLANQTLKADAAADAPKPARKSRKSALR